MYSKLKPCPFCGTPPQANTWVFYGISETRYFCPNQECPLSVRTSTLERWNRRPIEDALTARIAELEEERRWIPVGERKLSPSEFEAGKTYLVHGYDEWDTDEGTYVFDGFVVARYEGFSDGSYVFVDAYGTPYNFCQEEDCLYGVYSLPETK